MKKNVYFLLFYIFFSISYLNATSFELFPVVHSGRFMPAFVYAKEWKNKFFPHLSNLDSFELLFKIHYEGIKSIETLDIIETTQEIKQLFKKNEKKFISLKDLTEFFFENNNIAYVLYYAFNETKPKDISLNSAIELPTVLPGLFIKPIHDGLIIEDLPLINPWKFLKNKTTITFNDLQKNLSKEIFHLFQLLQYLSSLNLISDPYEIRYNELKKQNFSPFKIKKILNHEYPLQERLSALTTFLALPSVTNKENWISLRALKLNVYDEKIDSLIPIPNFSIYKDELYNEIKKAYLNAEFTLLGDLLIQGYSKVQNKIINETHIKKRIFPSILKLKIEYWMHIVDFIMVFLISYCFTFLILFFKNFRSFFFIYFLWIFHTLYLLMRCYLLSRPPVSNMIETLIFVPWVLLTFSILFSWRFNSKIPLFCATFASSILFIFLKLNPLASHLENVQAVLDSQFWLTIHVLMVVGSYGVFILSGLLGHIYLILANFFPKVNILDKMGNLIKETIFLGLFLLIPGTILGGVWAAQSWGRFWDWDPKESWAFITCCIYLAWVHAYYFGIVTNFGLAIGSIIGLMTVIFTWYGVNYILGTGLHSYGFGSGGNELFYLYLSFELFFLAAIRKTWYHSNTFKGKTAFFLKKKQFFLK